MASSTQVFELFPTPVMHVPGAIQAEFAAQLCTQLSPLAHTVNGRSDALSHTQVLRPESEPLLHSLALQLGPHVQAFGALIFGESLPWLIKEMWINVLQHGGQQTLHNHANCFVSGVLYLSVSQPSANTTFVRALGGREFVFSNQHPGSAVGPFNADKWVAPDARVGDLLLFPSHLLHEVPPNQGGQRISLSFNAIARRINAWGYTISLEP